MDNNEPSPVVVIKQKELDLAYRFAKAKQAADQAALEARQSATEMRDRAEREGQEKATIYRRAELESCDVEAEKIRSDGELGARWIGEKGSRQMDLAVQRILEIILPSHPQPGSTPDRPATGGGRRLGGE